jgi:hypothetical protein
MSREWINTDGIRTEANYAAAVGADQERWGGGVLLTVPAKSGFVAVVLAGCCQVAELAVGRITISKWRINVAHFLEYSTALPHFRDAYR